MWSNLIISVSGIESCLNMNHLRQSLPEGICGVLLHSFTWKVTAKKRDTFQLNTEPSLVSTHPIICLRCLRRTVHRCFLWGRRLVTLSSKRSLLVPQTLPQKLSFHMIEWFLSRFMLACFPISPDPHYLETKNTELICWYNKYKISLLKVLHLPLSPLDVEHMCWNKSWLHLFCTPLILTNT